MAENITLPSITVTRFTSSTSTSVSQETVSDSGIVGLLHVLSQSNNDVGLAPSGVKQEWAQNIVGKLDKNLARKIIKIDLANNSSRA
jgi:hypothetical protein